MSDEDADVRALRERAVAAAPAEPSVHHVEEASLARMKSGDDDESLDDAYRHVASCAICRARLTDAERGRELVAAALPAPPANVVPIRRSPRTRTVGWALAAAAALGLVAMLLWRTPTQAPLVITQRSYVGTMGTSPAPSSVPAADRNVELTLEGNADSAVVVVCDGATGTKIFPAQPFTRDGRGKLLVVLAPRLFAPLRDPAGEARAWVFAGEGAAVQRVLQVLANEASFDEKHVRSICDANDVRLAIVPLAR
jgi:hypothetical protein